jgi:hypothetical protein
MVALQVMRINASEWLAAPRVSRTSRMPGWKRCEQKVPPA